MHASHTATAASPKIRTISGFFVEFRARASVLPIDASARGYFDLAKVIPDFPATLAQVTPLDVELVLKPIPAGLGIIIVHAT